MYIPWNVHSGETSEINLGGSQYVQHMLGGEENNCLESYTFHGVGHRVCKLILLLSISHGHLQWNILDKIFSAKYYFYQIIWSVWLRQP